MTCSKDESFSARLEADQLVIDCASFDTPIKSFFNQSIIGQYHGASYSILPSTETWPMAVKIDSLDSYVVPTSRKSVAVR